MLADYRGSLSITLLAVGAAASAALVLLNSEAPGNAAAAPRLATGYYMTKPRLTGTDDNGRVLYRVEADAATQQLEDGSVAMDTVSIHYEPEAEAPWDLTAREARLSPDGKLIALSGDVLARTRSAQPETRIRTEYLELEAASYHAHTRERVTIDYGGSSVHAVGMDADLRTEKLTLLSNVNGKFVP